MNMLQKNVKIILIPAMLMANVKKLAINTIHIILHTPYFQLKYNCDIYRSYLHFYLSM